MTIFDPDCIFCVSDEILKTTYFVFPAILFKPFLSLLRTLQAKYHKDL